MSSASFIEVKRLKTLIGFFFFFVVIDIMAQTNLRGVIATSITKRPLPYVNIGIIDKSIGTVSGENGNFELFIPKTNQSDSIRISMIGFESKTFLVKDFIKVLRENPIIKMNEKAEELSEVIVSSRKLKTKILGNRYKSRKNLYEASADLLGSEIGIKIKIKRSPTLLKRFNTRVLTKKHSNFKFRLNIYDIKNGMPNRNLLEENIIIDANDIKDGWVDVNLEPYDIYVEDDFFVTMEWIQGDGKRKLRFPAGLLGPLVVERQTSHSRWNKHTLASIGFNVTVEY